MKMRLLFAAAFGVAFTFAGYAQSPVNDLLTAVKELQSQQGNISENQTKIDTKVNELAEQVRLARLYVSRAGGAHKAP